MICPDSLLDVIQGLISKFLIQIYDELIINVFVMGPKENMLYVRMYDYELFLESLNKVQKFIFSVSSAGLFASQGQITRLLKSHALGEQTSALAW